MRMQVSPGSGSILMLRITPSGRCVKRFLPKMLKYEMLYWPGFGGFGVRDNEQLWKMERHSTRIRKDFSRIRFDPLDHSGTNCVKNYE